MIAKTILSMIAHVTNGSGDVAKAIRLRWASNYKQPLSAGGFILYRRKSNVPKQIRLESDATRPGEAKPHLSLLSEKIKIVRFNRRNLLPLQARLWHLDGFMSLVLSG